MMRPEHPLAQKKMTLKTYCDAQHLLVSAHGGTHEWIDDILAERGRTRYVALTTSTYGATPLVLEATDLIMACPRRMGVTFKDRLGLAIADCPVPPPPKFRSVDMIWHARLSSHPAQIWIRQLLRDVAQSTEA